MKKKSKVKYLISFAFLAIISSCIIFAICLCTKPTNEKPNEETTNKVLSYDLSNENCISTDFLLFEYNDTDDTAIFIGLSNESGYTTNSWIGKTLRIPSEVVYNNKTYTVVEIDTTKSESMVRKLDNSGFMYTIQAYGSYVTALIIPNTVQKINSAAFYGMASLEYISTPFLGMARGVDDTTALSNNSSLHSMFSPMYTKGNESVKYYPLDVNFDANKGSVLKSWYLTAALKDNASWYEIPYNLSVVEITDEKEVINRAFFDIDSLDTVRFIDNPLTDYDIESIGEFAFASCGNLKEVVLPKNIGSLPQGLFSECASLGAPRNDGEEPITINLPLNITTIPDSFFGGCKSLKKIYAPTTINEIQSKAFEDCFSLEDIILFDGLDINSNYNVISPSTGFNLPAGLTTIRSSAFKNCDMLTSITIPSTVTTIEASILSGCKSLENITLPFVGTNPTNSSGSFNTDFGSLFSFISIDANYYSVVQKNGTYYLPKTLKSIIVTKETKLVKSSLSNLVYPNNAGNEFYGVESIILNKEITSIESGALAGNGALKNITVPFIGSSKNDTANFGIIFGNVSSGVGNFNNATGYYVPNSLENIKILDVNTVYSGQFYNLYFIKSVEFPANVGEMQSSIFHNNPRLESLTIPFVGRWAGIWHPRWPDYGWSWWGIDIEMRNSLMWIFSGSYFSGSYEDKTLWGGYNNRIRYIPSTLKKITVLNDTAIDTHAFRNLTSLEEVEIYSGNYGRTLSYIEEGCLSGCSNLVTLNVPFIGYNTNSAGSNAYYYTIGHYFGTGGYANSYAAYQYRNYYIPKSLTSVIVDGTANLNAITAYAFANMKSLTSVDFKTNSIASINAHAFDGCENLRNFTYGAGTSFTTINDYAFNNCKYVKDIGYVVPEYKKNGIQISVGNYAFSGTGISEIDFNKISGVGSYAFANCLNLRNVEVTSNIPSLGEGVFADCSFLTDVTLSSNTASKYLFKNCISLQQIDVISAAPNMIPEGMFDGCENLLYNGNQPGGLQINPSITEIGKYAFRNCNSLVGFEIPNTVTIIRNGALLGCDKLGRITIPRGVTNIESGVFTNSIGNGFAIYVYQKEEDRPATWVSGWNCNNPVLVIDAIDDSNYIFSDFDSELLGYVITGIKQGVTLGEDVILPRTHLGCPVVKVDADVFRNQNDVKTIIIPSSIKYLGNNCFNNGKRVDLYFENAKANIDSSILNNETNYIACGLVYYKDYWRYSSDNITPELDISKFEFKFTDLVTPSYSGVNWDGNNYPVVSVKTKAVEIKNDSIDSTVTNIIYDFTGSSDINPDNKSLFKFNYYNNVYAGKATVEATINTLELQDYLDKEVEGYSPYNVGLYGKKVLYFNINKADLQIGNTYGYVSSTMDYDYRISTLSLGVSTINNYILGWINGNPVTENYNFYGSIYTKSNNAGTYTIAGASSNNQIDNNISIRTKSGNVDVTSSFNIKIYAEFTISPRKIFIGFTGGELVTNDGVSVYEYQYAGYNVAPTLTAQAYSDKELNSPITDCEIAVTTSQTLGWEPSNDVLYDAYAYINNTGNNRLNYVMHEESGADNYSGISYESVLQKIRIVKAKIYLTIHDENYVIGYDDLCWSYSNWNNSSYYKITGLNSGSKLVGKLVSNSLVQDKTAREKDGHYTSNGSELNIIWEKANYTDFGSSNSLDDYFIYYDDNGSKISEMNFYETIVHNVDIKINYNEFTFKYFINGVEYLPTIKVDNNGTSYRYIEYKTDGSIVPVIVEVSNLYPNGDPLTGYTLKYSIDKINQTDMIKLGGKIENFYFQYEVKRDNFIDVHDNVWINVMKSDVEHIPNQKVEYDRYDYSIVDVDDTLFLLHNGIKTPIITKHGQDQEITIDFVDNSGNKLTYNPIAPGKYYLHITATEGEFFNALDKTIEFEITKRNITIYLDKSQPENPNSTSNPSGYYNGKPYTITINSDRLIEFNGLLEGDIFSGALMTNGSAPGIYDIDVVGDWLWSPMWSVYDSNYNNISEYYNVIVKGTYEILELPMTVTSSGFTGNYDTIYHGITVNISDPNPSICTIYYSLTPVNENTDSSDFAWSTINPLFVSPGTYTVYYKVVCPNYKTHYGSEIVDIRALSITWDTPKELLDYTGGEKYPTYLYYISYDMFPHYLEVINVNPSNAQVYYYLAKVGDPVGTYSTDIPFVTDEGEYILYIKFTCRDYEDATATYSFIVTDEFNQSFDPVDPDDSGTKVPLYYVNFDGEVLYDGVGNTSTEKTIKYDGKNHILSLSFNDEKIPNLSDADVFFSLNDNQNYILSNSKDYYLINAGTYKIYYMVRARGMKSFESYVTITITPKEFENITVSDLLNSPYNGKPQTVTINGLDKYSDLNYTLYYSSNYNATFYPVTNSLWSTDISAISFTNVCDNLVYIRVVCDNYVELALSGRVQIVQCTPTFAFDNGQEIEYKAQRINVSDLKIDTIHDGNTIATWYAVTYDEETGTYSTYSEDDKLNYAPKELGAYYVSIRYVQTANCTEGSVSGYFRIVPRKVTLEYIESFQYDGHPHDPDFKVITGTTDTLTVLYERADGNADQPVEIGEYKLYVYFSSTVVNYVLDLPYDENGRQYVMFNITKRKLLFDYSVSKEYDGSIWEMKTELIDGKWQNTWKVDGLLSNHIFSAHIYTSSYIKGTYIYSTISNINTLMKVVVKDPAIYDNNGNDVSKYYDTVDYNIFIKITLPTLGATFENVEIAYDGQTHEMTPIIPTNVDPSQLSIQYKTKEDVGNDQNWQYDSSNWKTTAPSYTNVGEYTVYVWIQSLYYDDFFGCATLTINKANLKIKIDEFDATYNNYDYQVSYRCENVPLIDKNLAFVRYYSTKDVTIEQLRSLYADFNSNNSLYDIVSAYGKKSMVNAGDYYVVVYFSETSNYYASYNNFEIVTVKKRPVYYSVTTGIYIVLNKEYDGSIYEITLGSSYKYDTGLLEDHTFDSKAIFVIGTCSKNAGVYLTTGETKDSYTSLNLPIHTMGFVYTEGHIYDKLGRNVIDNYMPVVYNDNLTVIIERTHILDGAFQAFDTEREYDGKAPNPDVISPSDGKLTYKYYSVIEENGTNTIGSEVHPNDTNGAQNDCRNVGYYYVVVSQDIGTNYYAPTYTTSAFVRVVPRNIEATWENTEVVFNGENQMANAYYKDIDNNIVPLKTYALVNWESLEGVLHASTYMVYAEQTTDPNYHITGLGDALDNDVKYFVITAKEYNIYLYKTGTSGSYIEFDTPSRQFTFNFNQDYFNPNNSNYTGDAWISSNLRIQKSKHEEVDAVISTIRSDSGTYYGNDMFNFTVCVLTNDNIDVTNSISFNILGGVIIKSNVLKFSITDNGIISRPYKGTPYTIWDFVTLINPTSAIYLDELLYSTNGTDYTKADIGDTNTQWSATETGVHEVWFKFKFGDSTGDGKIILTIEAKESFIHFKNINYTKEYNGLPVTYDTIKNLISAAEYNGVTTSFDNLVFKFYDINDLDNPLITRQGTEEIVGTVTNRYNYYPTNVGTYRVVITSLYDDIPGTIPSGYKLNYKPLVDTYFDFTIDPTEVKVKFEEELVIFNVTNALNAFGDNWTKEYIIQNDLTGKIPNNYALYIGFTLLSGTYNGSTITGVQRGTYSYVGIVDYLDDSQSSSLNELYIMTLFTPLDETISPYNVKFKVVWDVRKTDDATGTNNTSVKENYFIHVDFSLSTHYPEMNKEYSVPMKSGDPVNYYLKATIGNVNSNYDGNFHYGTLESSYAGFNIGSVNFTAGYDINNSSDSSYNYAINNEAVSKKIPGESTIYYRFTAEGFEEYKGSYKIKIGYIERQVSDETNKDISVEYNGFEYSVKVEANSTNTEAYLYLYNNGIKVSSTPLQVVSIGSSILSDEYSNYSVTYIPVNSAIERINIINSGEYTYKVKIEASTYYKAITLSGNISITKKTIYVDNNQNKNVVAGDSSTYHCFVHPYNGIAAYDTIVNSNDLYVLTYSDGSAVTDVIVSCEIKTKGTSVGLYSQGNATQGIEVVDGKTTISKNLENLARNYQITLRNVSIYIDKGTITPGSFNKKFVYDGQKKMFTATAAYPTNTKITYCNTIDGTYTSSLTGEVKPGTYTKYVKFEAANYHTLIVAYDLIIEKAPVSLTIPELSKDYDGVPIAIPNGWKSSSGIDITFDYCNFYKYNNGEYVSISSEIPVDVGRYKIEVAVPEDSNGYYKAGVFEKEFIIKGKSLSITWKGTALIYNGLSQRPYIETSDEVLNKEIEEGKVSITYNVTPITSATGILDNDYKTVGRYTCTVTLSGSNNYSIDPSQETVSYNIVKRNTTIVLNQSVKYDEQANTYSFGYLELDAYGNMIGFRADNLVDNHNIATSTLYCRNKIVGIYEDFSQYYWTSSRGDDSPVILDEQNNDVTDNYDIKYSLRFDINYSEITVAVEDYNGVYDGAYHSITVTTLNSDTTGFTFYYTKTTDVDGNPINYSTTLPKERDAGSYTIYYKVCKEGYLDKTGQGFINISKAAANIRWENVDDAYSLEKIYDGLSVINPKVVTDIDNPTLTYEYRMLNTKTDVYDPCASIVVKGENTSVRSGSYPTSVGKYYLKVTVGESANYSNGEIDIYFEIKQREIVITLAENIDKISMVYDGTRWNRSEDSPELNISNLVSGHTFTGILQTISANVGLYASMSDFEWQNNWRVEKFYGTSSDNLTSNYYVTINLMVEITTAKMDVVVTDYNNEYDGIAHTIKVKVNEPVGGYQVLYTMETNPATNEPINYKVDRQFATNSGLYTVYFMVICDNYETYYGNGTIKIRGLSSDGKWQAFVSEYEYNGQSYPNPVVVTLNTSTPRYYYYNENDYDIDNKVSIGSPILSPSNVGKYIVVAHYDDDGQYSEFDIVGSFEIIPKTVSAVWDMTTCEYTGDYIDVGAHYVDVNSREVTLTVTSNPSDILNVGQYTLQANLSDSNYQLDTTSSTTFTVTKKKIVVPNISNSLEFTYGDDVIITDVDGNIYELDEYGNIEEIRFIGDPDDLTDDYIINYVDKTITNINDPNDSSDDVIQTYEGEDLVYKIILSTDRNADGVLISKHSITISLNDYSNYEWDSVANPNQDQLRIFKINPEDFSSGKYELVITCERTNSTFVETESAIEPKYTVQIRDVLTRDIIKTLYDYDTLDEFESYSITYKDNVAVGTATATITGCNNYKFNIVKEFTIVDKAPETIQLVVNSTIGFIKVETDSATKSSTFTENDVLRTAGYEEQIFLGKIYHKSFVTQIAAQIANQIENIKIYNASGVLVFDGGNSIIDGVDYTYEYFGTGSYISLCNDSGTEIDRIYGIVFGDVSGDGIIDGADLNYHILFNGGNISYDTDITMADVLVDSSLTFECVYYYAMYTIRSYENPDGSLGYITKPDGTTMNYIISFNGGSIDFNSDYKIVE